MSDLLQALDWVKDEHTFVAFLTALSIDRRADRESWQWDTIEGFLEGATAWAEDSKNGLGAYSIPSNPWKRAADILYSGKIYE